MDHISCEALVNRCKQESKQILEVAAVTKIHWSHPKFTTFCALVEEILSYGVKKKYQVSRSKPLPPSGKVLHDLGKRVKEAEEVYATTFTQQASGCPDYACVQGSALTERRIVWVRVAMVEGKLKAIVDAIAINAGSYYEEHSVMRHPVYGDIFCSLLDGPCSLRFSRLKSIDSSFISPSPMEIVKRHTPAMAAIYEGVPTEEAWDHVQSLYQSPGSSVVFGKNNVHVQPPGFTTTLPGYLSLHHVDATILIKWLPNSVLENNRAVANKSFLWEHVMCIDVDRDVAHLHCHCSPGQPGQLILIGYDGIAYPPILFHHQPSLFSFLECLENTLLPQGCLEPPLWYLKEQHFKGRRLQFSAMMGLVEMEAEPEEWRNVEEGWNQVFRVRSKLKRNGELVKGHDAPAAAPITPLRSLPSRRGSSSPEDVHDVSVIVSKPGSLARKDWEKFQTKVSRQLLARYFYGWWSYCRHVHSMKKRLSHMINTSEVVTLEPHSGLDEATWRQFQRGQQDTQWRDILRTIYFGGMDVSLRPQVWPYLLGVHLPNSTEEERSSVHKQCAMDYAQVMEQWRGTHDLYTRQQRRRQIGSVKAWRRALSGGSGPSPVPAPTHSHIKASELSGATGGSHETAEVHETQEQVLSQEGESPCLQEGEEIGVTPREIGLPSNPSDSSLPTINGNVPAALLGDMGELQVHVEDSSHTVGAMYSYCDAEKKLVVAAPASIWSPPPSTSDYNHTKQPDGPGAEKVGTVKEGEEEEEEEVPVDTKTQAFIDELSKIDKDIPRCDRDYWYFKREGNLTKLRNIIVSYVWSHTSDGYSQGMCDLLAPLLVVFDDEPLAYSCYLKLMATQRELFPPEVGMNTRMTNLRELLEVTDADFFQYLQEKPMGDSLFYCYRWFLVGFKREFQYEHVFRLWETTWAARALVSQHFEEFFALAIMNQYKNVIMDARMDPSDIVNLFTSLAEKKALNCLEILKSAQNTITDMQRALSKRD